MPVTFTTKRVSRAALACLGLLGLALGARWVHAKAPRALPHADAGLSEAALTDAALTDAGDAGLPDAAPRFAFPLPNYTLVDAGWDRPIRVLRASTPSAHAIVYLHGYCGDVNAVGAFQNAAGRHGTVVALLGDQPCPDKPGRFKWSRDIRGLEQRIERGLELVNHALGLTLNAHDITLLGYSQGALRAESLARFYGKRYPRVILGGPPQRAKASHFPAAKRVAFFGGSLEDTHDMVGGADDLAAAGRLSKFFLIPDVDHGDFGEAGERVLGQVLDFVDEAPELTEMPLVAR